MVNLPCPLLLTLATWQAIWSLMWVIIQALYLPVKNHVAECPYYTAGINDLAPVANDPGLISL